MVSSNSAGADPRINRNKRPRPGSPEKSTPATRAEQAIDVTQDLSKAFETVRNKANGFAENTKSELEELRAYIERLESVYESQTSSMRRENMAKTQQAIDLERSLNKLREDTAVHPTLLSNARMQAANWREKHESLYQSHETLMKEWHKLREDTRRVDDRYAPINKRLAELKVIGQRTHDTIIRRIERLNVLYREGREQGLFTRQRNTVEMELIDMVMIICSQWEAMADEYKAITNGGHFVEEASEEGEVEESSQEADM